MEMERWWKIGVTPRSRLYALVKGSIEGQELDRAAEEYPIININKHNVRQANTGYFIQIERAEESFSIRETATRSRSQTDT